MKKYYYSDGKQQIGPLSKEELRSKGISKETLVWYEGLTEWTKAGDVEELVDLFSNTTTPPPLPEQKTATPPPMPKNKTVTPPPMPKQNDIDGKIKTKSKKKITKTIGILVGCILLLFAVVFIKEFVEGERANERMESIERIEREHPERYLTLTNISVSGNKLMGIIANNAEMGAYKQVFIKVSYYDGSGNVIQSNKYIVDVEKGLLLPGFKSYFEVELNEVKGLRNRLNVEKRNVEIIGAKYYK